MKLVSRRAAMAIGAGFVAGCATKPLAQLRSDRTFCWDLHAPETAGVSSAGLETVRSVIRENLAARREHAVVIAAARRNRLFMYEAFGVRDPVSGEPARVDDIYRMMSTTKQVTAISVLMMADAGKLDIDDRVSRYVPEFSGQKVAVAPQDYDLDLAAPEKLEAFLADVRLVPAHREITIRDLLTHTSGLGGFDVTGIPGIGSLAVPVHRQPGDTLATYVPRLGAAALDFQPGERWSYSGLAGPDVLLRIVEIVSGDPADRFLQERLFEPLGMHDTFFRVPADKQDRLIPFYQLRDGLWQQEIPAFGGPTPNPVDPGPQYLSGAAGLFSTARDFLNLQAMLYNSGELNGHRILSPAAVRMMSSNQVGEKYAAVMPYFPDGLPRTAGMGFGFQVSITLAPDVSQSGRGRGSFGWDGAYGTDGWVDPEHELFATYFVQQSSWPARTAVQRALRQSLTDTPDRQKNLRSPAI